MIARYHRRDSSVPDCAGNMQTRGSQVPRPACGMPCADRTYGWSLARRAQPQRLQGEDAIQPARRLSRAGEFWPSKGLEVSPGMRCHDSVAVEEQESFLRRQALRRDGGGRP
jgi:hypothetical protein